MFRSLISLAACLGVLLMPVSASGQCRLCDGNSESFGTEKAKKPEKAIRITITAGLNFDRLALTGQGGGEVSLDPVSGQRIVRGDIEALGGMWLSGSAEVTGSPGRIVRIMLPQTVVLTAPGGATATLEQMDTNLSATPRLDNDGRLVFSFGGRLVVRGNVAGQFRGRIPVTADYD